MGNLKLSGPSVLIHIDSPNTVEPQKDQVHQVVLGKRFRLQMRMHEAKAPQTPTPSAAFGQVRYVERARPSNKHIFDTAVAAYEQSYLTSGFK
jgi:hypothetical protein